MGARLMSAARAVVTVLTVAVVIACAACTGGNRTDSASGTGEAGMGSSTDSGVPGSADPPGTTVTDDATPGGSSTAAAENLAVALPLAGLYGVERLRPKVNGKAVRFTTTGSCADALSLIGAGQWSATALAKPDDFSGLAGDIAPWYLVSLSKGQQRAYLKLAEGEYTCDATIVPATSETVTVGGALTASGRGLLQPFQCGPGIFTPDSTQLIGFYSLPGGREALVTLDLPAALGDVEIERDGSEPVVTLLPEGLSGLKVMTDTLAKAFTEGDEDTPAGAQAFAMTEESTASVTIASLYPLQGQFRFTGLVDESGAALDMAASFYCDTVALPERGGEGDEPLEDGDDEPDGPGSITIDISGGPLQGSHTAIGDLTCQYGVGTPHAWWLFFGATDEDGEEIDEPADTDLMMMMLWSAPPEEVAAGSVMYDEPLILDIGFGLYILDSSLQLHVNGEVGGSGGEVQRNGNVLTFSATAADGAVVDVTAQCAMIDER